MTETMIKTCENPVCDTALTGKQQRFCSDKCRMTVKRTESTPEPEQIEPEQPTRTASVLDQFHHETIDPDRIASLEDYKAHPEDYATRANPDKLNWGPFMSPEEKQAAGFVANRTPIPGDWDYQRLEPNQPPAKQIDIKPTNLDQLPLGVARPAGTRTPATAAMEGKMLHRRIIGHGVTWIQSPEYAELIYRLLTQTVKQLEKAGIEIPAWKKAEG